MCRVIQYLHPACGHLLRYEPIPSALCPTYTASLLPSTPCPSTLITHTNHVAFPLLCVPCFRLVEARIDEKADRIVEEKRAELADVERDIEEVIAVVDLDMLEGLNVVALGLEREVREVESARGEEIRAFRASQGVWGNG